jgi:hypothetical protein
MENAKKFKRPERTKKQIQCVIWESNPGLPDVARMATENFTTKPITLVLRRMNLLQNRLESQCRG